MQEEQWEEMVHKTVAVSAGYEETFRLGRLLGSGGAGAVYELCEWNGGQWVIKVLDPDFPVAEQELKSLNRYRGSRLRYAPDLMKFHSWTGKLYFNGKTYPCYMMRKGKTLAEAIDSKEPWLSDPKEVMRVTAHLVNGICSLKNAGLSHGDIKAENILLCEFKDTFYVMFSDYGTVAGKKIDVRTIAYTCKESEFASPLEERIAYDLHCLCLVLCRIYDVEDVDVLPLSLDQNILKLLRIMRNRERKAFDRLQEIMNFLKNNYDTVPVSFYLDAVPQYGLTEEFPFEKVMKWGEYAVLRDENAEPGEPFDPLLLMKIPAGRYDTVYKILVTHNKLQDFVMPIARYIDKNGNEYVLIHAPDDKNKCRRKLPDERIQDDTAIPCTLDLAGERVKSEIQQRIAGILANLKVNIEFAPGDIWHMDRTWKLNLFSVDFLEIAEEKTKKLRLIWK